MLHKCIVLTIYTKNSLIIHKHSGIATLGPTGGIDPTINMGCSFSRLVPGALFACCEEDELCLSGCTRLQNIDSFYELSALGKLIILYVGKI